MSKLVRKRRRDGRGADHAAATVAKIVQPQYILPPYELLDEAGVELVHEKSMQILEQGGIAFYDQESRQILQEHGVRVEGDIAYFDRALIAEYIAKAPGKFTHVARNAENSVIFGGNHVIFSPVYGPPFVMDYDRGRREATLEDLQNFIKLTQMTPYLHHQSGVICEPADLPFHERHMDIVYAHIKYGDKPIMGASTMGRNAQDTMEMGKILFGEKFFGEDPVLHCTINVSSPRRLDDKMLGTIKVYARHNQIVMVTPFILSGAMGPVSIAGTVAQLNAETLATIAFTQMVNPGTPCVYGSFQAIIDLQSGAPVFGAPESQLALYLSGQMARHYGLPFRAAGAYSSSKVIDAQGAYESVMAMFPSLLVRPNFILHAAGWLESGLVAGYEKFVLDCELLGMYHTYLKGVDWSDEGWAMDAIINEVPPGGHHLGSSHTMRHFRTAFYRAELFDYESAEAWQANGSIDSYQRANAKWKQQLKEYERPPLDPAIDEALREFMTKRKAEIEPQY